MAFTPTFTEIERAPLGALGYAVLVDVALDSANAYVSGGFSLAGAGLQTVLGVASKGTNTAGVGYLASWNTQTSLLQILSGALAEFSGTFGAGIVLRLLLIGF